MWWQIIIKIAESSRSEANKREFILWTTSIIRIVVYEESDLLTFRLALAIALTTLRGLIFSLVNALIFFLSLLYKPVTNTFTPIYKTEVVVVFYETCSETSVVRPISVAD